ncbi:uncharacterized protein LOC144422844 [Styela clava]
MKKKSEWILCGEQIAKVLEEKSSKLFQPRYSYTGLDMKISTAIVFISVISMMLDFANANSKHMICKSVDEVFNEETEAVGNQLTRRHHRGIPGKRGAKGEKGDRGQPGVKGEPGIAAIVDYDTVNATIKRFVGAAVAAELKALEERLFEQINETKSPVKAESCTGFIYTEYCYWVEIHSKSDTNYAEAKTICLQNSGKPADIVDSQHYQLVNNHIRLNMPSSVSYVNAWLSMTINPSSGAVRFSSGNSARNVNYFPSYPKSTASRTQMAIGVQKDPSHSSQGMFNSPPNGNLMGVVCQK